MRKRLVLLTLALMLALASTALAGGWAVIVLDDAPGDIRAGEPWTVNFTVLQHGQTPVHELDDGWPIEATLVATHAATGRRVEAVASPTEETGHFTLEVTFPEEGSWEWTIFPAPLMTETQFEPLTVLPAAAVAPVEPGVALVEPGIAPAEPAAPVNAPAVVAEPETAAQAPAAVEGGISTATALRWGALAVALVAVALLVAQSRRRAQPAGVES